MQINLIQVGKTKHQFVQAAEQEYLKRLTPYLKIKILTLKAATENSTDKNSQQKAKLEEAEKILAALPPDSLLIVLDEHGQQFTSIDFAQFIQKNRDFEGANLTFVIGGPFGLDQKILSKAKVILSFSKFTFTHEMIRMLLLEQLYRAFTIISKKTYHY